MKITLLALALTGAVALSACSKPETDTTTTPEPVAAAPEMPAAAMPETMPEPPMADNPMVGGAQMYADKDIIDNAVNSKDHTTLVAAIQAAGLVDTLKGTGPFTVFAPVNGAFDALPAGTVDTLLKPESKADLTKVLTYHVVPGKIDAATLVSQIQSGGGSATLTTVQGGTLTAKLAGAGVSLTDAKGNVASVTTADVMQSNGVIHVIDKVLMP